MNIDVYIDGAAIPNPGSAGWAAVFVVDGSVKKQLSGHIDHATNNEAEITAAIRAIEAFTRPAEFTIYSDSQYVIQSVNEWIPDRGTRGYKNAHLFETLLQVAIPHTITWKWVKGHAGNQYNKLADDLANKRAESGA